MPPESAGHIPTQIATAQNGKDMAEAA